MILGPDESEAEVGILLGTVAGRDDTGRPSILGTGSMEALELDTARVDFRVAG